MNVKEKDKIIETLCIYLEALSKRDDDRGVSVKPAARTYLESVRKKLDVQKGEMERYDTPNVEELVKIIDNGWDIRVFRNNLGSITAQAVRQIEKSGIKNESGDRRSIEVTEITTDDFTVERVLHRLAEKVSTGKITIYPPSVKTESEEEY